MLVSSNSSSCKTCNGLTLPTSCQRLPCGGSGHVPSSALSSFHRSLYPFAPDLHLPTLKLATFAKAAPCCSRLLIFPSFISRDPVDCLAVVSLPRPADQQPCEFPGLRCHSYPQGTQDYKLLHERREERRPGTLFILGTK